MLASCFTCECYLPPACTLPVLFLERYRAKTSTLSQRLSLVQYHTIRSSSAYTRGDLTASAGGTGSSLVLNNCLLSNLPRSNPCAQENEAGVYVQNFGPPKGTQLHPPRSAARNLLLQRMLHGTAVLVLTSRSYDSVGRHRLNRPTSAR